MFQNFSLDNTTNIPPHRLLENLLALRTGWIIHVLVEEKKKTLNPTSEN
jgi:hypothetical protein